MKVLLVAPRTDLLLVNDEVEDILRSGLSVTPLTRSRVNSDDVIREARNDNFDVLWLSTHGGEYVKNTGQLVRDLKQVRPLPNHETDYGVQLSDGIMPISELVALVRGRFRLVVLNTCDNLLIAQQLQEEANVAVICTLLAVPDRQAYQTGSHFAHHLADTGNFVTAYRRSKPGGNRTYLYLAALEPSLESLETLAVKIDELGVRMQAEAEVSEKALRRYQRLLYISLAVHAIELPTLVIMAWILIARGG